MPGDVDAADLFALLDDEHARALLVRLTGGEMTAQQLNEDIDASLATVYRRLDALAECGLVDERTRVADDGNHYGSYEATLDGLRITLTTEGFEVTVDRREDVADRFTDAWRDM